MSLESAFAWLEGQAFAVAIAESGWLFPTLESLHVIALTMVVGTIAMLDVRLLGFGRTRNRVSALARHLLPFTWSAFCVAALTGGLLFSSQATTYAGNLPFRIKLVLLAAAGLNMAVFHMTAYRRVGQWDDKRPPVGARLAGGVSLTLWASIVVFGRWIGFV